MRILFVSTNTHPLAEPFNGDSQRTRLLLQACERLGKVDILTFAGEELPLPKKVGRLKKWLCLLPHKGLDDIFPVVSHWETAVDTLMKEGNYDLIVARYLYRAIPCGLWKYRDRLVVDFDDSLPFYFLNLLPPHAPISTQVRLRLMAKKASRLQRKAVRSLRASFFAEGRIARRYHGTYLPNIPFYTGTCPDADFCSPVRRILFVGQLEYKPNSDGLTHFLQHIYLPLRERVPNLEMHVAGLLNDEALRRQWQRYPGVTVTGFVADIRAEYEQCHAAVVPVYQCGGTNIKLLEALAMNRACVTTQKAFGQLQGPFGNGTELCAAASDNEFVDMLERLLTDEKENQRIAHNGKAAMERYHSYNTFCDIVAETLTH